MSDAELRQLEDRLGILEAEAKVIRLGLNRLVAASVGRVSLTDRIRGALLSAKDPLSLEEIAERAGSDNHRSCRTLLSRLAFRGQVRRLKQGWISNG